MGIYRDLENDWFHRDTGQDKQELMVALNELRIIIGLVTVLKIIDVKKNLFS